MSDERRDDDWVRFDPEQARSVYRTGRKKTRDGRRLEPAGHVLVAVLLGFALAMMLNAQGLKKSAESLPLGAQRSVAVTFARPLAAVSHFLFLDRPNDLAKSALGKGGAAEEKGAEERLADLGDPTGKPTPTPTGDQTGGPDGDASPSPTALPTPTRSSPLRCWVGGDSMVQVFGQDLVNKMRKTGVMKATLDYRISTGLSRPDYFNWPKHLRYEVNQLQPDVIVIMFGANDGQDVEYPMGSGKVLQFGSQAWLKLYRKRVGEAMDIAMNGGRTRVYWVGQPIVRSTEFQRVIAIMNKVYEQEAKQRPELTYIPTWDLFEDSSGKYNDYLRTSSGKLVLMRQSDGVHLSLDGGDRMASEVLDVIKQDYHLAK